MKKDIHPEYNKVVVHCGCGSTFETCSTIKEIHAEICSVCHPFYTGKQKFVDTAGPNRAVPKEIRHRLPQKEQKRPIAVL